MLCLPNATKPRLRRLAGAMILSAAFAGAPAGLMAQDAETLQELFSSPANRFLQSNPTIPTYVRWDREIVFSIGGTTSADMKLFAISEFAFMSRVAGVDFKLYDNGFLGEPSGPDRQPINSLIIFDTNPKRMFAPGFDPAEDPVFQQLDIDPQILDRISEGLPLSAEGCFAAFITNEHNEISGSVTIVDKDIEMPAQYQCVEGFVPTSLGVYPGVTQREKFLGPNNTRVVIPDVSETVVALQALQACQNQVHDNNIGCPMGVTLLTLQAHGEAIK